MERIKNPIYAEDVQKVAQLPLPWEKLQDASVLISGASGLVGTGLVDVLMQKNAEGLNCKVYALGRNAEKAKTLFARYWGSDLFCFLSHDISKSLPEDTKTADYILHLASNTHPVAYATDPIGTVTTNILGTKNLLDFAAQRGATRFLFASSCEIYGENRGDAELFDEQYCGYIDCNTLRAGYPESKRCSEALCQAYKSQTGIETVIARLARTYGPTMLMSDTKAISQFIRKALAGEDIVLKSAGTQYYSYTYVMDAVSGLLTVLLVGENGQAYNVADNASDIMLKDLAAILAKEANTQVVFELPDDVEKAGYSTATKARQDGGKIQMLGWKAGDTIETGIRKTLAILKSET